MPAKPTILMDLPFRRPDELFRPEVLEALHRDFEIIGGLDQSLSEEQLEAHIGRATFFISAFPRLNERQIRCAKNLRAVIEVAGGFNEGLDYAACFESNIEVLSSAPGFRQSVAEMTLAMILAGARGLIAEHEAFRSNAEVWLDDQVDRDFSLFGAKVGFIGYGQIARETHRLMAPFAPQVYAFDPYLPASFGDVTKCDINQLVSECKVVVVAAVPSADTQNLLSSALIQSMRQRPLVVVVSRSWVTDFEALVSAAQKEQITLATDVFPVEPVPLDDPIRKMPNVILSPHRAAAVKGGRWLIGDLVLQDVNAIMFESSKRTLKRADPEAIEALVYAQKNMQKHEAI